MKNKKQYSMQEVAKILRTNRRTLFNWEKAGKIPKQKRDPMSRYRIYSEDDVKKLKRITGRS